MEIAKELSKYIGESIIKNGYELAITGARSLDAEIGNSAVAACEALGVNPRERIRTYPHGRNSKSAQGFGMVIEPIDRRWQDVRTFVIQETDAVIAVLGGKGTADCIQKAILAKKPVFPIAVSGGGAQAEWEKLKRGQYYNATSGDLDFLADRSLNPKEMAETIIAQCKFLLRPQKNNYSRRVFIVHGHDDSLKNEMARFLERLDFEPVILHEQPDRGRTIFSKLRSELSDVGFAFILLTPDDFGEAQSNEDSPKSRARQNVVFEHGLLIGTVGPERVCAIVKDTVEIPSDIQGVIYKHINKEGSLDSIALEIIKELKSADYEVDANRL